MFEKNLAAIREKNPELAQRLEKINLDDIKDIVVVESETKDLILGYREMALHSTFDPIREAKAIWNKTVRSELKKDDFLINYGLGLGYLFKRGYVESQCKILLFEPFIELLRFVLEHVDFSAEFSDKRVYVTDNVQDVLNKLQKEYLQGDAAEFLFLPAYAALSKEILEELTTRVVKVLESKSCDANTIYKLAPVWTKNFIECLPYLENCVPLGFMQNAFENKTALIIAPGPSLLKDIEKIKTNRERFAIISAGKAVQVLAKHGIIPDFVTFADALGAESQVKDQEKILEQTNLILSLKTENLVFKLKSKSKILQLPETSTFIDLFKKYSPDTPPGSHKSAGSVSIINYFIAKELGFKNIAFAGLDLSFPDNKIYATNEELKTDANGKVVIEGIHSRDKQLVYTKDRNGNGIPTRDDYLVFIKQFEEVLESDMSLVKVVNTSLDGAYIKGMDYMEFDKFIENIDAQEINIENVVKQAQAKNLKSWKSSVEAISDEIFKNADEIAQVKKDIEKLVPQVKNLIDDAKSAQIQDKMGLVIDELSKLRTTIMSNLVLQNLMQGALWEYVRKYKTGVVISPDAASKNLELDYDLLVTIQVLAEESLNWINKLNPKIKAI